MFCLFSSEYVEDADKKNGCMKELTKVRTGHGLGLSEAYVLSKTGVPLCGLTIEEAKAYYQ